MAVEQFTMNAYSAIVSWTYFLLGILFFVKIIQFFSGGSIFRGGGGEGRPREYKDKGYTEDTGKPTKTEKEEAKLELMNSLVIKDFTAEHHGNKVILNWTPITDPPISYYKIKRKPPGKWKYFRLARVSNPPHVDSENVTKGLRKRTPVSPLYYAVRAVTPAGKGPWSFALARFDRMKKKDIKRLMRPIFKSRPRINMSKTSPDLSVTISWKEPRPELDLKEYVIYYGGRHRFKLGFWKKEVVPAYQDPAKTQPITSFTLRDVMFKKGRTYRVQIYAVNESKKWSKPREIVFSTS